MPLIMESRRNMYKQRGRTGQDRSERAKAAQVEQKKRRQDALSRKRPLTLAQLEEEDKGKRARLSAS